MKALTLEILRGGFLPPHTFSLLLKAVCIIASRQGVKYFLKTQLCFCRLILNRKKAHSPECTENVAPRPGTVWECLTGGTAHVRRDGCVQFSARGEQSATPAPQICVWETHAAENRCQLCSSFRFALDSSHLYVFPVYSSPL